MFVLRVTLALLMVLAVTGCTPAVEQQQSSDPSLATLRQVDDLPLYEMTLIGDYDPFADVQATTPASPFGCSLFLAAGDRERPVFARNFDWDPNPALLLHADPPDGYASISLVDISYLGITNPMARPKELLKAPLLPFDGMNEKGLAIGLAADTAGRAPAVAGRPTVGSVRIIRLMLDHAATVDEALLWFDKYNLDFSGGPALHYLISDAAGRSAVVEFIDGQLRIEKSAGPWQAMTNFQLVPADAATRAADRRYAITSGELSKVNGALGWQGAMRVLQAVAQPHTRWSVTYELRTGDVHLITGQKWDRIHTFKLAGVSPAN